MPYTFFYDVPADAAMYERVKQAIGDESPKGLVVHLVVQAETGLRHIDVWDSEQDWQRFHDERVEPAVHSVLAAVGFTEMPPDPPFQVLELVDPTIGAGRP
jgi:hypothetical protein